MPVSIPSGLPSAGSKPTPAALAALDALALDFLKAWIAESPERMADAGNYYVTRLKQGKFLQPHDLAMAQYAARVFAADTRMFELGGGFGELGILLSLSSFSVISFEFTKWRQLGAVALADGLRNEGWSLPNLTFVYGRYPDDLTLRMVNLRSRKVFVSTNTGSSYMQSNMETILRSLALYDDVLIDIRNFGFTRSESEVEELLGSIFALGFEDEATVFVTNLTEIHHFRRRPRLQAERLGAPGLGDGISVVQYSEDGDPVPARLRSQPLHIFTSLDVPVLSIFSRLEHLPAHSRPDAPGWTETFQSPVQDGAPSPPVIEGDEWRTWKYKFSTFGPHYVTGYLGTFKCLLLDPMAGRDAHALAIFRFVAANTLHSEVDRMTIAPWPKRSRYLRPDLLLPKLFMSDQPLGLQCSHVADVLAYLLHMSGYEVRRVGVVDPEIGVRGHTVLEVLLPEQQKWVMLDADFGVLVKGADGRLLGVADLIENRNDADAFEVVRTPEKRWLADGKGDIATGYQGQRTWNLGSPLGRPTVEGRSYHELIQRCFRKSDTMVYSFRDGFGHITREG